MGWTNADPTKSNDEMFSHLFRVQNVCDMWMDKHDGKVAACACSLEASAHSTDLDSTLHVLTNTNMHFEVINLPFQKISAWRL